MLLTDKPAFAAIIAKTWRFYDKTPTGETLSDWFDVLESFPLEAIATAFKQHLTDPKSGQFIPKPADIIRQLQAHQSADDSGHPGPEEAWGMLIRLIQDEEETGVLTEEMREAWSRCSPILSMGDEVGARMCFLETYRKALQRAVEARKPPKWSLTIGSDAERRKTALIAAVNAGRISSDYAAALLPALLPMETVAGLLETDTAPSTVRTERWRRLAAQLRQSMKNEGDSPAMQAEQERIRRISARKHRMGAVCQDRAQYQAAS